MSIYKKLNAILMSGLLFSSGMSLYAAEEMDEELDTHIHEEDYEENDPRGGGEEAYRAMADRVISSLPASDDHTLMQLWGKFANATPRNDISKAQQEIAAKYIKQIRDALKAELTSRRIQVK